MTWAVLQPYQRVDSLEWTEAEKQHSKMIKIKGFPGDHKAKLFRVVLSTKRTDYIVTNEMAQDHVGRTRGVAFAGSRAVSPRNQTTDRN